MSEIKFKYFIDLLSILNFKYSYSRYSHIYTLTHNEVSYRIKIFSTKEIDFLSLQLKNHLNYEYLDVVMKEEEIIKFIKNTFVYELRQHKINKLLL